MTEAHPLLERWVQIDRLYASINGQAPGELLSAAEQEVWRGLSTRSGAAAWLAGRWLGKSLVRRLIQSGSLPGHPMPLTLRDVSVVSTDSQGRRSRPSLYLHGRSLGVALSLSHSRHFAYAAIGARHRPAFGVDVADSTPLSDSFAKTWFLPKERRTLKACPVASGALRIWTAKEACYKACHNGEAFRPERCEVTLHSRANGEAVYHSDPLRYCRVRWIEDNGMVRALAVLASGSGMTPTKTPAAGVFARRAHD